MTWEPVVAAYRRPACVGSEAESSGRAIWEIPRARLVLWSTAVLIAAAPVAALLAVEQEAPLSRRRREVPVPEAGSSKAPRWGRSAEHRPPSMSAWGVQPPAASGT